MNGLCECGCGELAPVAKLTRRGYVKGQRMRFIQGHHLRTAEYKAKLYTEERNRKISEAHADGRIPKPHPGWGEDNPSWRGDEASHITIHAWLVRNYPKRGVCEECGAEGETDYAFQHHPARHTRNREDYREMCRSCHWKLDGTVKNIG